MKRRTSELLRELVSADVLPVAGGCDLDAVDCRNVWVDRLCGGAGLLGVPDKPEVVC